jgi:branched-chain amino acid aminotransferase
MIVDPRDDSVVWFDGSFVAWKDAAIHVSAHHYGFGVFEGLRSYETAAGASIFRLADHTARLLRSAHILGLRLPSGCDAQALSRAQDEVVARNGFGDAYIRPFVFCSGTLGLTPYTRDLRVHVAILALEWKDDGAHGAGERRKRGVSLRTASFTRHHPNSLCTKAKANGNYMNSILALREAQSSGADDALLLDHGGFVTEASGANIFVVRDGVLYTPPRESVLEGITRDTVIALAGKRGLTVAERRLTRDEVYVADEAFLTGTAAEITPISEVDGRRIGTGGGGPIAAHIQETYSSLVRGRGHDEHRWLSSPNEKKDQANDRAS